MPTGSGCYKRPRGDREQDHDIGLKCDQHVHARPEIVAYIGKTMLVEGMLFWIEGLDNDARRGCVLKSCLPIAPTFGEAKGQDKEIRSHDRTAKAFDGGLP